MRSWLRPDLISQMTVWVGQQSSDSGCRLYIKTVFPGIDFPLWIYNGNSYTGQTASLCCSPYTVHHISYIQVPSQQGQLSHDYAQYTHRVHCGFKVWCMLHICNSNFAIEYIFLSPKAWIRNQEPCEPLREIEPNHLPWRWTNIQPPYVHKKT